MAGMSILQGKKESAETALPSVSRKQAMVLLHYPVGGRMTNLVAASPGRRVILRGNEIQWVHAKGNYVTVQTADEQFRIR